MRLSMLVVTEIVSVCIGFGVQVFFVGGFLYVTYVSMGFKVEFISRLWFLSSLPDAIMR